MRYFYSLPLEIIKTRTSWQQCCHKGQPPIPKNLTIYFSWKANSYHI